ncbi:MAG: hypothetical protein KDJ63_09235 [Nitratireductor sp.]|nr:hypothetical protein [Nitratireductor sp.]
MNSHVHSTAANPAASETAIDKETLKTLYQGLQSVVTLLIDVLDRLDGEADLECNADPEPSLGWPNAHGPQQFGSNPSTILDDDREADDCDDEPSFGTGTYINGEYLDECEYDKADHEPSLGWTATGSFSSLGNFDWEASGQIEGGEV